MRGITRAMLRAGGGLAVTAALVVGGTGVASAAPVSPAAHTSTTGFFRHCNPWAQERWNLNGRNHVEAVYLGSTFTYSVTFRQYGGCLRGTLTDPYYPTTGPIFGTVYRNHVTFRFRYPAGSVQGLRTFVGTINRWGRVFGRWSETGSENGSGTFTLARHAAPACPWWYYIWDPYASCQVFP